MIRKLLPTILLFMIALATGCVGTVEEVAAPGSLKYDKDAITFNFPGIITARGISHNKIELEFFPAGNADITYQLYINNSTTPVTLDPKSILSVTGGKLLYTVDDLVADREYKFKLTAQNPKTNAISRNENEVFARTYDNIVADFDGISKLTLAPGSTSTAIRVDWIAPTMSGVFEAGSYDPVNYEVTVISSVGGAANLNNPTYTGTDKRTTLVPMPPAKASPSGNPSSTLIENLTPNTLYYIQVRAVHSLYLPYYLDPTLLSPLSREANTKYRSIRTDPSSSDFFFQQDTVILANAPSINAFDTINVFWQPGAGNFSKYRVFLRKYDGLGDPETDDKLTEANLQAMTLSLNYTDVASTHTNTSIDTLENGSWYQVKVALCKSAACPIQASDPNVAIISDMKAIRVHPTLASFSGINSIQHPVNYTERDIVNLKFDSPIVSSGYANALEFYCVDPSDKTQMVKLTETPNPSTGISRCNNLYLTGTNPSIDVQVQQKVKGLVTTGTTEYCFAATPAIVGLGAEIRLTEAQRIIRCTYPEVLPPTIGQFGGLNKSCSVSGTSAYVTWNLPTGGVYSGFKVFWKEKNSTNKFSFAHAAAGDPGYFNSGDLTPTTTSATATNLMPGKVYQIGVLSTVDMTAPAPDLYSEYNLNVVDCVVPLPIATFKGFTRIFAVGPKMDGRMPNDTITKAPPVSGVNNALIFEAINAQGIPFEVAMDGPNAPNTTTNFTAPPGRDFGTTFSGAFDGAAESDFGFAMSRNGIVSLAWEDVEMDFPDAQAIFNSNQPASPALRSGRLWGYKVFRSADNKLTWKELTTTHGPVYAENFTYYPRANAGSVTKRMAFFTDYSVKSLQEVHDDVNAMDIERARTYYYKVVPLFNGQNLAYAAGNHHLVRVTVPPPNMALVHRWMANRNRCLEIDKTPVIGDNYTCVYNGVGATPKTIPHRVNDTVLDQGGDLLVDRQELGCRFTRGEKTASPEVGASTFAPSPYTKRDNNDDNFYPIFKGYRTVGGVEDPTPLRGCSGKYLENLGNGTGTDYPGGFLAEYQRNLQGDCIGNHLDYMPRSTCSSTQFALGEYQKVMITTPGINLQSDPEFWNCSNSTGGNPTNYVARYTGSWAPNIIMQSEFLAVFYNAYSLPGNYRERVSHIEGPATGSLTDSRTLDKEWDTMSGSTSCTINLASIDGQGYMKPRWLSVSELTHRRIRFKNDYPTLIDKTVNELTEVAASTSEPLTFYNGAEVSGVTNTAAFKLPTSDLRSSARYRGTTKIGRIMTSNAAKLPPLGRLSSEAAESVCSTYFVQTGIASESGTFSPDSKPQAKRPLRRMESVTAAAWPEKYNTTAIADIERSTNAGSCVNTIKGVTSYWANKGEVLRNNLPNSNNLITSSTLVTGSSPYNGTYLETHHSASCISRYGVQDMVGNLKEANSERLFCDYSQDEIRLGPVTGAHGGGDLAQNVGNGGPDYPFFNLASEGDNWAVLMEGTPVNPANGTSFEIRFRDPSFPPITNAKPWVKVDIDSGYCSVVDNTPSKRSGLTDFFKDPSSGFWTSMYNPGGAINPSIIVKPQTDQDGVKTWRNGDGRFMDFGPAGMGFQLDKGNKLSLLAGSGNRYFNPLIGLPLVCEDGSCNDQSLDPPNDNTSITLSNFLANIRSGQDDTPVMTNFPVGNSEVVGLGIADYRYETAGYTEVEEVPSVGGGGLINYILEAVLVDDPYTMGNPERITRNYPSDYAPGTNIKYYNLDWNIERGTELAFLSGGGAKDSYTGRYTAQMTKSSNGTTIYSTGTEDFSRGARCAVMINQD